MLAHYHNERELFKEAYDQKLTDFEARVLFEKLRVHYKFKQTLEFYGDRQSGRCGSWRIALSHSPSVGLLVHEVAHALQMKRGTRQKHQKWHTKRMFKIMNRVLGVVNGHKAEWLAKAKAKAEQKIQTVEKHEEKVKQFIEFKKTPQYQLEVVQKQIKAWESKQRRAENRLKKLRRREKFLQNKINREVDGNVVESV